MKVVVEEGVEFDDVWVVQVELDFYLCDELVQHVFYFLFWYFFQREYPTSFLMLCRKYLAKGSRPQALTQLKVAER